MNDNITECTTPDIETIQANQSVLLAQWKHSSTNAVKPSMENPVFNKLPDEYYVDVPKAKLQALETARAFAVACETLAEQKALKVTPEIYQTLTDMAAFSALQLAEAQKYADLEWPYSLITPRGEDVKYQQRRRDLAMEAMTQICDTYGALNNG